ncbi:MAG: 16S rRNA (cytidine(1402)-2'-O)-methyltransferase, partial [Inquilinus sp.]|nr:16S rRNA (cytidine(1402)-2'-O)-methyltransferase [Inquilinus sp.]
MTRQPPRQRSTLRPEAGARQEPERSGTAERDRNDGAPASKPPPLPAGLYLTAVPIGNAGDITRRALDTLAAADAVACEDTRMTAKLLGLYGISRPLLSYHDHNADKMRPVLLRRIAGGEAVALVSDAGMPLISDPGYKLVRAAHEQGLPVTCLPGANAPLTALVLSGLPSDRFLFAGFPPPRKTARRNFYAEFEAVPATLVFFESAKRLPASLADLAAVFGDREAAVTRELTKKFEQVRRGRLPELAAAYAASGPPRGEVVVVVGPPVFRPEEVDPDRVDALLQ